jgi:hypothetical protein
LLYDDSLRIALIILVLENFLMLVIPTARHFMIGHHFFCDPVMTDGEVRALV